MLVIHSALGLHEQMMYIIKEEKMLKKHMFNVSLYYTLNLNLYMSVYGHLNWTGNKKVVYCAWVLLVQLHKNVYCVLTYYIDTVLKYVVLRKILLFFLMKR